MFVITLNELLLRKAVVKSNLHLFYSPKIFSRK